MQMVQESAVHFVCSLCQQDDDGVAQCTFAILHGAAPNTAFSRQRATPLSCGLYRRHLQQQRAAVRS